MKKKKLSLKFKIIEEKDSVMLYTTCPDYPEKEKDANFNLEEISEKNLMDIRLNDTPAILYKTGRKLYIKVFEKEQLGGLSPLITGSICAKCKRCRALPDSKGGCRRVRTHTITHNKTFYQGDKEQLVKISDRIEQFEFIEQGFETFNIGAGSEWLIVKKCRNFKADN